MTITYVLFGIVFVWLAVASFFIFKTRSHYLRLTKKTKAGTLETALERLLDESKAQKKEIKEIEEAVLHLDKERVKYFQKVGFVRFNPFDRVGGEQSFVVSLLDKEDNGIVLNFLYTREGVRIYAKPVKGGKGTEYELAKEELEAVKKAK